MSLECRSAKLAVVAGFASVVLLSASQAWATSGEVGRTPICLHPVRSVQSARAAHIKTVHTAETVIVSLIDAGTTAWNATLGAVMPAPELVLKRAGRV